MSLLKKGNKKKGFTLMELLIVIAIIAILAAVIAPNAFRAINRSKTTAVISEAKSVKTAMTLFLDENRTATGLTGDETTSLGSLKDYLERPIGAAPFGGSYTYDDTTDDTTPANRTGGYLIVPNVPTDAATSIAMTLSGSAIATSNAEVHWATADDNAVAASLATGAKTGLLAIRIHQ